MKETIASKEQCLPYKMKIFLLYDALVLMNRTARKPPDAIPFPAIVVGARGSLCGVY
jgi:hypothetical protein